VGLRQPAAAATALVVLGCGSPAPTAAPPFIDWGSLRNPVLAAPDRALKDLAVVYSPATAEFYIFASVRFEADDPGFLIKERSFYRTKDFKTFTPFVDGHVAGPGYGPGSPDVMLLRGVWHMVFQAESPAGGDARILRYSTSTNLRDWSAPQALAPELLDPDLRNIDGALAEEDGYFYLGWKQVQTFHVTRSEGRTLDRRWLPALPASAGGQFAENYQFLKIDGEWRMIATGRDVVPYRCRGHLEYIVYTCNHEPFIYRMDGTGGALDDWTRWIDKTHLSVPFEGWNTIMHANSGYLTDWRRYDGYFYLFYAGSDDGDRFDLRGHGKIGVARSRDLREWHVAGDVG
jgi:hypothetical protein